MTDRKKIEELGYLQSFKFYCKDFPDGEIIPEETPDFIVKRWHDRVGIEVTKIFTSDGRHKTSLQAIEAARDRITRLAKEHSREIGVPPRAISLFFNWTVPLHRKREAAIAEAVAQVIYDELPSPDESIDLECHHGSMQPVEVDGIIIHRACPIEGFEWRWHEASRRVENAIPYLKDAIKRKAKKIRDCCQKCDECWLLIVAGEPTLRGSGNISPDETTLNHTYVSPFTRTYFFDNGHGRLVRLNTVGEATVKGGA